MVAGTAAAATEQTIELSRAAQNAGADGVQVVLPYYHVPSEEGLVRHYLRLADAFGIGVMIYNNPVVSKLWMPPTDGRCAEHPNIIADKENTSDVTLYKAMRMPSTRRKCRCCAGLGIYNSPTRPPSAAPVSYLDGQFRSRIVAGSARGRRRL